MNKELVCKYIEHVHCRFAHMFVHVPQAYCAQGVHKPKQLHCPPPHPRCSFPYRFACGPDGMNKELVCRYIELSALLLVPITPHTCEHIWGSLLKKSGSVLKAGWPQAAEPDFIMQRAAQYIEGE